MDSIDADAEVLRNEVNRTTCPATEDWRAWANDARAIRQRYEALGAIPAALSRYVDFQIEMYRTYDLGFTARSTGSELRSQAYFDQADVLSGRIRTALSNANATCASDA